MICSAKSSRGFVSGNRVERLAGEPHGYGVGGWPRATSGHWLLKHILPAARLDAAPDLVQYRQRCGALSAANRSLEPCRIDAAGILAWPTCGRRLALGRYLKVRGATIRVLGSQSVQRCRGARPAGRAYLSSHQRSPRRIGRTFGASILPQAPPLSNLPYSPRRNAIGRHSRRVTARKWRRGTPTRRLTCSPLCSTALFFHRLLLCR